MEKPKEEVQPKVTEEQKVETTETVDTTTIEVEQAVDENVPEVTIIEEQVSCIMLHRLSFGVLLLA